MTALEALFSTLSVSLNKPTVPPRFQTLESLDHIIAQVVSLRTNEFLQIIGCEGLGAHGGNEIIVEFVIKVDVHRIKKGHPDWPQS